MGNIIYYLLYIGIGNIIFSILVLIFIKQLFIDIRQRERIKRFIISLATFSIALIIIWGVNQLSIKNENKNSKDISYNTQTDTLYDFYNLNVVAPNNDSYSYKESKFKNYEQLELVKRKADTILSVLKIFRIDRNVNTTFNEQVNIIIKDALKSNKNVTYQDIGDILFIDEANLYKKDYKFKFTTSVEAKGSLFLFEKDRKVIFISVVIFKYDSCLVLNEIYNIVKQLIVNNIPKTANIVDGIVPTCPPLPPDE